MTALAVALAIPAFYSLVSAFTGDYMSIEAFLAIGAISFVLALIGGAIFGYPTLWFLKRRGWKSKPWVVTLVGSLVGALGGILLGAVFWQGNLEIVIAGLWAWSLMGAIAGFVSAPVWLWLHAGEGKALDA